ncbi:hypothetical protein ACRB68_52240 [Actinomadura sp. RB68]|uniref:Uncharacterized protein n=1 Tax=Actinomadura macrotermitis TaxID=2585200 RepID=A0A7K0C0X6_9ACTN|nr:hypothetical protein [Actinomadura macrotermitis]
MLAVSIPPRRKSVRHRTDPEPRPAHRPSRPAKAAPRASAAVSHPRKQRHKAAKPHRGGSSWVRAECARRFPAGDPRRPACVDALTG